MFPVTCTAELLQMADAAGVQQVDGGSVIGEGVYAKVTGGAVVLPFWVSVMTPLPSGLLVYVPVKAQRSRNLDSQALRWRCR